MKRISVPILFVFSILLLALSACNSSPMYSVEGVVTGAEGEVMYLESVGVSSISTIDSVTFAADGRFKFKENSPQTPEFYRLRLKKQLINIAVDSIETIKINADAATFATSYKVEGSENCKQIKEITLAQLDANVAINKLRKAYNEKQMDETSYQEQIQEVSETYKEMALKHIFAAPMSMAAYYALFQKVDGLLFFDPYNKKDSKAYAAVATSFNRYYPNSSRSKHLYNLALQSIKVIRNQRPINLNDVKTKEVNYVDIALPNVHGKVIKLSDTAKDKAVLLCFTAYQTEWSPNLNMTLGDIYTKYVSKDFQIYQISLDSDLNFWQNAASNLPWMCVRDPQSVYSQIAVTYNVRNLPALFLLDKQGALVKRIEKMEELEADVKALL